MLGRLAGASSESRATPADREHQLRRGERERVLADVEHCPPRGVAQPYRRDENRQRLHGHRRRQPPAQQQGERERDRRVHGCRASPDRGRERPGIHDQREHGDEPELGIPQRDHTRKVGRTTARQRVRRPRTSRRRSHRSTRPGRAAPRCGWPPPRPARRPSGRRRTDARRGRRPAPEPSSASRMPAPSARLTHVGASGRLHHTSATIAVSWCRCPSGPPVLAPRPSELELPATHLSGGRLGDS